MRPSDIGDGLRLCRACGWNQTARDWAQFLAMEPDGARVAECGGRVVGTVATIRYGTRFGWIGMVLVDPAARGRGIGTLLLDQATAMLADMPLVRLDATPAGHGIYLRRNFTEEGRLCRLQATVPGGLEVPAAAQARRMTERDLSEVIALDEQVFGANRAEMLRWIWDLAPEYAWAADRDGVLSGYTFGRHGHAFEYLGPVVAVDEETARLLATACLSGHAGRQFVIDAPVHAPAWLASLAGMGFREQRPLIRMSKGAGVIPGDPSSQFAILGPEFG
jgi:GNAT superfamily N-acetyltransferase